MPAGYHVCLRHAYYTHLLHVRPEPTIRIAVGYRLHCTPVFYPSLKKYRWVGILRPPGLSSGHAHVCEARFKSTGMYSSVGRWDMKVSVSHSRMLTAEVEWMRCDIVLPTCTRMSVSSDAHLTETFCTIRYTYVGGTSMLRIQCFSMAWRGQRNQMPPLRPYSRATRHSVHCRTVKFSVKLRRETQSPVYYCIHSYYELTAVHFVKSYCTPSLLYYGCEIWSFLTSDYHKMKCHME